MGFRQIKGLKGKAKRAVQQFTPHDWTRFEWKSTSSPKNYFGVIGLMIVVNIPSDLLEHSSWLLISGTFFLLFQALQCELNCFYLKYLLWVPPEHPLNTYRLTLMFLFSLPAARDVYQYLMDG